MSRSRSYRQAKSIQAHHHHNDDDIVGVRLIVRSKVGWLVNFLSIIVCGCMYISLPVHVLLVDAVGINSEPPVPAPNVIFGFINAGFSEATVTLTSADGKPQLQHQPSHSLTPAAEMLERAFISNSNSNSESTSFSMTFTVPSFGGFRQVEIPPSLIQPTCDNRNGFTVWAYMHFISSWKPANNDTWENTRSLYCNMVYDSSRVTGLVQSSDVILGIIEMSSWISGASTYIESLPNDIFRPIINTHHYPHHGFIILFKIGYEMYPRILTLRCRNINNQTNIVDEILNRMTSAPTKQMYLNSEKILCHLILINNNMEVIVDTGIFQIQSNTVHYIYATNSYEPEQYYLKMETSLASLSTTVGSSSSSWSKWQIATIVVSCILAVVIIGTICLYKHHRSGGQYPACCRTRARRHQQHDNHDQQHDNNHYHRIGIGEHNNQLRAY